METVSLTDAKDHLSRLVDTAAREHERYEITRRGHSVAVIISKDELDILEETLYWASQPTIHEDIAEASAQFEAGDGIPGEQVGEWLDARRRGEAHPLDAVARGEKRRSGA